MAPAVLVTPRGRTKRIDLLIKESLTRAEKRHRNQDRAYEEVLHRYSNELLDDEERMLLLDRKRSLRPLRS